MTGILSSEAIAKADYTPGPTKPITDEAEHQEVLAIIEQAVRTDWDRELGQLVFDTLLKTYKPLFCELDKRIAPRTLKFYANDFKRFKDYCQEAMACELPTSPAIVASFLHVEKEKGAGPQLLKRMKQAIAYAHRTLEPGQPDPCEHRIVKAVILAAQKEEEYLKKGKTNGKAH